jgi:hypothetical protein
MLNCRTWIIVVGLLLSSTVLVRAQTSQTNDRLTILSSPAAPGRVSKDQIATCLQQLVREWKLTDDVLPHVVVYHVSNRAASAAYVAENIAVRRNSGSTKSDTYFEVWLVGEPNIRGYVLALQNVLETHFDLKVSDHDRAVVMARVTRMQDATVDVMEGK